MKNLDQIALHSLWLNLWRKWRLAAVRSTKQISLEDLVCHKVKFKETAIEIEFEKIGEGMTQIRVKMLDTNMAKKILRVTLRQGDREVMSYLFDGNCVLFENIPFGQYTIFLVCNDEELGKYHFRIKGNSHE